MTTLRNCYVFVYNQYSDWEPALVSYGLHTFTDASVITFSLDGQPVTSGGNMHVQPQQSLADAMQADIDLLIIPGGASIGQGGNTELLPLIHKHLAAGKMLAAICDATVFLGQHGFLDNITHTGNHPEVLKMMAPAYKGMALYQNQPAVNGGNIITAAGTAMVAFTKEIFTHFNLLQNEQLNTWFSFFLSIDIPDIYTALPLHFLFRRYQTNLAGLLPLVRHAIKEIYQEAATSGLEVSGAQQWHYHGFDGHPDTVFTLDIGLPVATVKPVAAPHQCETIAPFHCVSLMHKGPWEHLGETYAKLISAIQILGLQMTGYSTEQYLLYDFENPEQNLTNIRIGIAKP
ncbi:MAG TPA: DJ-1/PfpI family protein [Chitinophaga sp.]|uniref:DJ-1/PfpI family protein n=1 Tax=Chitinophaga sp. TaxID=1869181 RepID=UPI002C7F2FEF|nr:DJ-1/PfpI family protein [Chitinophaga sp.]HVI46852.1 DJ-1/PfpI family protein [Chitinophaga sp.]